MTNISCSMRVLVIDENDDAAISMAMLLKESGHEAHVASCGRAALQQAALVAPDVMFIDLAMPQIDGLSLARQFRQTPEFAEIPLVAVSRIVDAEHRAQALAAGFDAFLPKPYPMTQVLETLGRLHDRAKRASERAKKNRSFADQSREPIENAPPIKNVCRPTHQSAADEVVISIKKSGISNMVALPARAAADELRRWLKEHGCRVGPVFEPPGDPAQFCFFVYSRRRGIGELAAKNVRFRFRLSGDFGQANG